MSQRRATPKLRRATNLLRAALGLPLPAGLSASERAALALRRTRPAAPPQDPTVVFLIPLVGRQHVTDHAAVTARLLGTLASFRAQTDPQWRAIVCSQEDPGLPEDHRITFLPFTSPVDGNDKWDKLAHLATHLPEFGGDAGYAMPFDADDLLHPGAVAEMRRGGAPGGYLVRTGYVRDVGTGDIALAGPRSLAQPLRKPFWKLCGSCAAFAFDTTRDRMDAEFIAAATRHEHRMFPYLAALAGRRLTVLSRPSVLYELNHGENFGARRGRVSFKTRFVQRYKVADPAAVAGIESEFALGRRTG
ncbi:hypothetical protein [Roseisalinus antarcticus]|uniref:Glycosyl transferase family 2 n=1 Tax=Roseisalinus antarcticus TaxID=254357 RepID=A0A1Y5TS00_9RHOB|nr:hypothetical protein [Roseisalinus antarcticus]SLN66844.1 hypothetical protein ROA7023_03180 [Roseisalinus antarcticus]